jgi:C1A family cysteine protease
MTPRQIKRYGWRQSSPDPRDIRYQVAAPISLPPSFDLREKCPPVYNQGQTGSCTGNAWAAAYEFLRAMHSIWIAICVRVHCI